MFVTVNIDETVAFRETGMSGDQIHERPAAVTDELHAQVHGFFNLMQMLKPETFLQWIALFLLLFPEEFFFCDLLAAICLFFGKGVVFVVGIVVVSFHRLLFMFMQYDRK